MVLEDLKGSGFPPPVNLHPSSSARQKQNKPSRYLNETARYGAASLNSLIRGFLQAEMAESRHNAYFVSPNAFSICLRAVYCWTATVLYSSLCLILFVPTHNAFKLGPICAGGNI